MVPDDVFGTHTFLFDDDCSLVREFMAQKG
jgi:hypothetical protein